MIRQAQKMQEAMQKLQSELSQASVEGSSGGGAVKIACTGTLDFTAVKITPDAVDPADVATLEDLVLAAIKDACEKAKALGEQKTASQLKNMNMQLPPGLGF